MLTFGNGEVRNRLPLVHRHSPSTLDSSTAEVDDEFASVTVKSGENRLKAVESECAGGE